MSVQQPMEGAPASPQEAAPKRLLDLQAIDLGVDRLRARLAQLESQGELRDARSRVASTEARLGELQLSVDAVAREQRRLESDVDSLEQKIEAERRRLFDGTVANAKELQSIEQEVENLRGRKARLEDELIQRMEEREELEGRLPPMEAELVEARGRLAEIERTSASDLVDVEKEVADASSTRAILAKEFPDDVLELYEDLRRQKKGVAAAALVDGVCQGCHQKLSPRYLDQLKREDGIRRCEYCRRILVLD